MRSSCYVVLPLLWHYRNKIKIRGSFDERNFGDGNVNEARGSRGGF